MLTLDGLASRGFVRDNAVGVLGTVDFLDASNALIITADGEFSLSVQLICLTSIFGGTLTGDPKLTDFRGELATDEPGIIAGIDGVNGDEFSTCRLGGSFAATRIFTGDSAWCDLASSVLLPAMMLSPFALSGKLIRSVFTLGFLGVFQ